MLFLVFIIGLVHSSFSQCEEGWRPLEERCYYFSSDLKTWHEALEDCVDKRANLISIQDLHEQTWVQTQIGSSIFWIGLNDIASEGTWDWSDERVSCLSYWEANQPDNQKGSEDCAQVRGVNQGRWHDESCTIKRQYICKRQNPHPAPLCDTGNGWEPFGCSCYKLKAELRKSWAAARSECVREGGDLVSITSSAEEQYVTSRLDPSSFDLWIGFSTLKCTTLSCQIRPDASTFSWSDASTSTHTNWRAGQPDLTHKRNGVCTAVIKNSGENSGKWSSRVCRHERPFMCKRALITICPPGWLSFAGSCYWLVSNRNLLTTWYLAQTTCSEMGANLLTIQSKAEQFFINVQLPEFHRADVPDLWIGLSDKDQDGTFKWADKIDVEFSNWNPNFPENTEKQWDCGHIYTENYAGKWETANCFENHGYICKMSGGQNAKPTVAPDSHCDEGYLLFGDYCYHFEAKSVMSWQDAENYCVAQNGHLVSIHDEQTLSFLTAHMSGQSWVGLNDIKKEGTFVWTDGTPADFLPWSPHQPDDHQGNEDCVHLWEPWQFKFNDLRCSDSNRFICQKAKGRGPPAPPTPGPVWNEKCGSWVSDPLSDDCYQFNSLSFRTWADARADCIHQGGDLVSISGPAEQAFIQGVVQSVPTGVSLWMGAHHSETEEGRTWSDGSLFRYINWSPGNPDDHAGEDCLSINVNTGRWNDDNCEKKRGYICKRRGNTPKSPPPHDGFFTSYACQDSRLVLHCPSNSVINIQSAFFGRRSATVCPYEHGASGICTVDRMLPLARKSCDNREFCVLLAHASHDPCPTVSKYLEVVFSCEPNVCLRGLGVEDGNVTSSMLSASSSQSGNEADKARLGGNSCWMPSSSANSWIQVNVGELKKITGVVIQGCPSSDHWVSKFEIQTSTDGRSWTDDSGSDGGEYSGCVDRSSPKTRLLGTPVSAQYVRVLPLEWNSHVGLRLDILGCVLDYAVSCSAKPVLSHTLDKMIVHCPAGCAKEPYAVYGTDVYRGDSNICAAAVHAGVVLSDSGGDCTLLKAPGQNFYSGSSRNGITSRQSSGQYSVSYQFTDGELWCPGPDWLEFGEFCYKRFDEEEKTWQDARTACVELGADLVSIRSLTEQSWLESYLYLATSDVWTGLNDLEFSGFYTWSDHHAVTVTHWAPGQPNNHVGFNENCVEMCHETGRWNDVTCSKLNTYICKKPRGHYPLPSPQPTIPCAQGWEAFERSCYWFEEAPKGREDAHAFCASKNSSLLDILDTYEQAHFTASMGRYSGNWWIGLRARGGIVGVDYYWDNDVLTTFTHWGRNEPNNQAGSCVTMSTSPQAGFWHNAQCDRTFPFVCETPRGGISPPTRPPTPPAFTGCEHGWSGEPHFRSCYRLFTVEHPLKKSWSAALEDCRSRGADLVSIHNPEEEMFLSQHSQGRTQWIGLSRSTVEGGYNWSDASPVGHTNWDYNQPEDHGEPENCVVMVTSDNGTSWWNHLNCEAHQDWICMIAKGKKPVLPPSPPSPVAGGVVAGAVIGALLCVAAVLALLFYVFRVKGVKLGDITFFKPPSRNIDVVEHLDVCRNPASRCVNATSDPSQVTLDNPTFTGESDA